MNRTSRTIGNLLQVKYIKMLLLHFGIAFGIYIYEPASLFYFLGVFGYFLFIILQNENRSNEALMAAAYVSGAEIFWRMTGGMVFYETGKYAVILFLIIGMFFKGSSTRAKPFWIYLLILLPGIFISSFLIDYGVNFRTTVAFNLSGPVCLGISAIYCYYKKIKKEHYEQVLLMLLLPIITNMFYLYLYTPSLRDSIINVGANYSASGGYGPNQISTIMGMGAFLLIMRLFVIKSKFVNIIDIILLSLMSYRAMVTFSRGGVITAIVCSIAFLFIFYLKLNRNERTNLNIKIIVLGGILFATWMFTTVQSSGLIVNRYTNRDAAGRLKSDITTGRVELVSRELEAFYYNPLIGVGVGRAKSYREEGRGVVTATHNEISRLLSEHGLLGVIAIVILLSVPVLFWFKFRNNFYFLAFMAFWFMTINHSAMRIALPGFVYGLALLYIVEEKRKNIKSFKKPVFQLAEN